MSGRRNSRRFLVLLLALLAVVGGVWVATRGTFAKPQIRHVILISLDTTRADRISCLGYPRPSTPNIDSLASQGYLFTYAMTPIPFTLPAHTSMLTGTIPPYHGKHNNNAVYFDPQQETLASILQANGYYTAAFVGSQVLNRGFGLNRGFDEYHDEFPGAERIGGEVNRAVLQWLNLQPATSPFFLFVHYYDPHDYYKPPEPFATRFKDDLYAGEIAYVDDCIGQVINKLKEQDMYDSSLIIVTGDHGEMLGEHGELTHMYFIYQSALHVPMVFKLPGSHKPQTIDDVTSIIDIVPTVCELLGLEPPPVVHGKSLAGHFGNNLPIPEDRYLYCESLHPTYYGANSLLGLVGRKWKYIHTTNPELYDLDVDPGELNNLADSDPRRAAILQENLTQISAQAHRLLETQAKHEAQAELDKHLRTLGYASETFTPAQVEFDQQKPDPKDLVELHNAWSKAQHEIEHGRISEAMVLIEENIEKYPKHFSILGYKSSIQSKDYRRAITFAEKEVELNPDSAEAHERLALACAFDQQDERAIEQYEVAIQCLAGNDETDNSLKARLLFQLAMTRLRQQQFDLAISQFEESLGLDAEQPMALNGLATALLNSSGLNRDSARALQLAEKACLMTQMKYPNLLQTLARAHAEQNNLGDAINVATQALSLATAAGDKALVDSLRQQLASYNARKSGGNQ